MNKKISTLKGIIIISLWLCFLVAMMLTTINLY